ncbi:MAG TPA: nucleotidyltransferase family protein [Armatimonadota bacterium]|jgi:molybdopterin-guanine dinucleotide biosynthesis protein A
MTDAVVLAGGSLELDRFPGVDSSIPCKAAILLLGKPMVWWTVAALRACPAIGRIVVLGGPTLDSPDLRALDLSILPEAGGIAATFKAGLDALPDADRILGISADVPLLTPEAVADLLERAPAADVVFPFCERADIERDFPDRGWIFARTPDGEFTGCSAFVAKRAALLERWKWVEELLGARRRSVLGLAMLVGPAFALKYVLHRLKVADIEDRMSRLLRVRAKGYRTKFTDLAMDVDKTSDIAFVEGILRNRGAGIG